TALKREHDARMTSRLDFTWIEPWAPFPAAGSPQGWAHTDIAVSRTGEVWTGHATEPIALAFSSTGVLDAELPLPFLSELHSLRLVASASEELLWVADIGSKRVVTGRS